MWWVKESERHDRGGFQNRDVGRTQFNDDYGPDYGVDYARFADTPNFSKDFRLLQVIRQSLEEGIGSSMQDLDILVKNGFVFVKGNVPDSATANYIADTIRAQNEVRDVIVQLKIHLA